MKKLDLPARFYVDPKNEYSWCAPKGTGQCQDERSQKSCESVYADHNGDKNCVWRGGRCMPGPKCDNARERTSAARRLGLTYYGSSWRRDGVPISGSASDYNHNKNRGGASKAASSVDQSSANPNIAIGKLSSLFNKKGSFVTSGVHRSGISNSHVHRHLDRFFNRNSARFIRYGAHAHASPNRNLPFFSNAHFNHQIRRGR